MVLTGANGAGKTNLIEAISLLAPGRGLRRATMEELAFSEGDGAWAVSAEIEGMLGLATLGTGIDPPAGEDSVAVAQMPHRPRERCPRRRPSPIICAWSGWRPAMDPLFNGPASERRRFLDRLVLAVDAQHSSRVAALERSLRSRNRLLEDAAQRSALARRGRARDRRGRSRGRRRARGNGERGLPARSPPRTTARRNFPRAEIALDGWMEKLLPEHSATEIEDRYRALLKDNRARDAAAGRTLDGPHLSDLAVSHAGKGIPAREASTGEQKALLIRLVLAHAGLIKEMTGFAPLLLLDEVVAHLDPGAPRRALRRARRVSARRCG